MPVPVYGRCQSFRANLSQLIATAWLCPLHGIDTFVRPDEGIGSADPKREREDRTGRHDGVDGATDEGVLLYDGSS